MLTDVSAVINKVDRIFFVFILGYYCNINGFVVAKIRKSTSKEVDFMG